MKDVMVDLETFGTDPGSTIVSIGAVFFDLSTRQLGAEFYAAIDLTNSPKMGVDMSTVIWWMKQSDAARAVFDPLAAGFGSTSIPLAVALDRFTLWLARETASVSVWGNGANFDNVLLRDAYRVCDLPCPWPFYMDRCYRTLRAHYKAIGVDPPFVREGLHHNALDDAKSQAAHLIKVVGRELMPS